MKGGMGDAIHTLACTRSCTALLCSSLRARAVSVNAEGQRVARKEVSGTMPTHNAK